ncbi:hypothetical protein BU16DRAFT_539041 [Lophium mytilinum]|uniref:Uncharacterized protein n=1 Tax=Lophium mytilinum TaxID=390894 RepID=A0A6A6QWN6_9PEZI|nr:hypothetical protein BU16DRAFT_539041 [Lophium mytilinum]
MLRARRRRSRGKLQRRSPQPPHLPLHQEQPYSAMASNDPNNPNNPAFNPRSPDYAHGQHEPSGNAYDGNQPYQQPSQAYYQPQQAPAQSHRKYWTAGDPDMSGVGGRPHHSKGHVGRSSWKSHYTRHIPPGANIFHPDTAAQRAAAASATRLLELRSSRASRHSSLYREPIQARSPDGLSNRAYSRIRACPAPREANETPDLSLLSQLEAQIRTLTEERDEAIAQNHLQFQAGYQRALRETAQSQQPSQSFQPGADHHMHNAEEHTMSLETLEAQGLQYLQATEQPQRVTETFEEAAANFPVPRREVFQDASPQSILQQTTPSISSSAISLVTGEMSIWANTKFENLRISISIRELCLNLVRARLENLLVSRLSEERQGRVRAIELEIYSTSQSSFVRNQEVSVGLPGLQSSGYFLTEGPI